ncbi:MAG: hypothetical protein P8Y53_06445 [Pseudolabrys sp.]
MKSFIIACVAAAVIAIIGVYVLNSFQQPVAQAFSTPYVRV